mmetsp:Transcript_15125/g.19874  ORF Transcript_15125/g.19874 Transcript_15125/m.19874 type:complete len:80 (+) Transcript_15125:222-461(+)
MVRAPNPDAFFCAKTMLESHLQTCRKKTRNYVNKHVPGNMAECFPIALFEKLGTKSLLLYSYVSSQLSESMNRANLEIR